MLSHRFPRLVYKFLYYLPYSRLRKQYGKGITHLFILNSLICGGAELEAINYIKAIQKLNPKAKINIITTTSNPSTWSNKVNGYAKIIPFGKYFSKLPYVIQIKLLANLIFEMRPKIIHLNNSALGYDLFIYYANKISLISKIFVSVFCNIITAQSESTGWPVTHLPRFVKYVTKIFCDNSTYLRYLNKNLSFRKEILSCHYQPVSLKKMYLLIIIVTTSFGQVDSIYKKDPIF